MIERKDTLHYDEVEDRVTIASEQDVEPIIRQCQEMYNNYSPTKKAGNVELDARIPLIVVEQIKNRTGIDILAAGNEKHLEFVLNSPSFRAFRTSPRRVKVK